jgi:hypothetical protein
VKQFLLWQRRVVDKNIDAAETLSTAQTKACTCKLSTQPLSRQRVHTAWTSLVQVLGGLSDRSNEGDAVTSAVKRARESRSDAARPRGIKYALFIRYIPADR